MLASLNAWLNPNPILEINKQIILVRNLARKLEMDSVLSAKAAVTEREAAAKAIKLGDVTVAAIHAETAIREEETALELKMLAARLSGVVTKMRRAVRYDGVAESMTSVSANLARVFATDRFVSLPETMRDLNESLLVLDAHVDAVARSIDKTTDKESRSEEVALFLKQLVDEREGELPAPPQNSAMSTASDEDLVARMQALGM